MPPAHRLASFFVGVDIGNSRAKFGVFHRGRLSRVVSFSVSRLPATLPLPTAGGHVAGVFVASVVPEREHAILHLVEDSFRVSARLIRPEDCDVPLGVTNRKTVGVDRVLAAKAAYRRCAGALIVVSIGTAITVDRVSEKGVFEGGAIIPGPELWLSSLAETSLLPKVSFSCRARLPGKNTSAAIAGGARFGLAAAIDRLISEMEHTGRPRIFLTGGWARTFKTMLAHRAAVCPHLVLEGLHLLFRQTNGKTTP